MGLPNPTAVCYTISAFFLTMIITKIIVRRIIAPTQKKGPLQPPVVSGTSLVSSLPMILTKGLQPVIHDLHTKLGSVFTINLFGLKNVTLLLGPEVTSHFFQGTHSEICQPDMYKFTIPIFGKGVSLDADFATRNRQMRFGIDAMRTPLLRSKVDYMVREVQDYFGKWGQDGIIDLKHELGEVVMLIASRCLLGKEVRDKMFQEVTKLFHDLFENGTQLTTLFFPNIPIPANRRRDKARAKLGEIFHEIVRSRRISGQVEDDVLQKFIDSKCMENGRSMSESEITGLLIGMLFAGQHTSSSAASWTGACLISHEKYLAAAIEEQQKIIRQHGQHIDYNILSEMGTLHCCIKEAIRMHSPAVMMFRSVKKKFAVQTREGYKYEIPEGHTVATSIAAGNQLPHIYKDPHVYDPYRFGPGREEDKIGGKFAFTSFGGGRHACIGEEYAYMKIKVIWSCLLRNFELKMLSPFPEEEVDKIIAGPKGRVMVSYKRRLVVNT
ncbi:obtusifoliol 14-alpha demethylase-like [Hordeum vulgare subsp. vulgare]|uniref:obtusifoliol 14-alpha demethylase-like n=1 Tax=Hordeum vulgare subsp. vulgare TaxID=112509 RepID=UPI00162B43E4|nr:obtusifoliol 14-alpha demethylase-like [Hordeum vulgare subsp. vulgare]